MSPAAAGEKTLSATRAGQRARREEAGTGTIALVHTHSRQSRTSSRSGQALILAVVIMLLLLFLGTIFLRTVLANLGHAEESVAAANEYSAAEAGIRFADTNLTTSELGADWRPRASYSPGVVRPDDPDYYWIQPFDNKGDNDPSNDVGGYVRYNLGDSRFLLRVTYNPNNDPRAPVMPDAKVVNRPSALSRFIMIEVVGRRGSAAEIDKEYEDAKHGDPIDPTIFKTTGAEASHRFRRELIAFKAIGINNYLRFVTDRNRLGRTTYFGVDQMFIRDRAGSVPQNPPQPDAEVDYPFRLGIDPAGFTNTDGIAEWARATGSPIRVNGNLVWYGSAPSTTGGLPEITLNLLDPRDQPWNVVEVAGKISREGRNQWKHPDRMALRVYDPSQAGPGELPLNYTSQTPLPTSDDDAAFAAVLEGSQSPALTVADCYLDNKWLTAEPQEKQGVDPRRSIRRIEPPQIETVEPGTGLLRYQAMTYGAPAVTGSTAGASVSWQARLAARYGYGAGVYIDNARHNSNHTRCQGDVQFNHSAEKLRDDWMRPYSETPQGSGSGWKHPGRVYEPVGTLIILEPDVTVPGGPEKLGAGLMSITRADYRGWRSPTGERLPVQTVYFEIQPGTVASGVQEYTLLPKIWSGSQWQTWDWTSRTWVPYDGTNGTRYPFNGVIFAEGNVRIRGRLPRDTEHGGMRLTVVSRGTIYLEGNLLKGDPAPGMAPQSFLAVLARDYVCLNTTQFVQVQTDFVPPTEGSIPPFFWRLPNNRPDLEFQASWDFGVPPTDESVQTYYGLSDPSNPDLNLCPALFLRHQADRDPVSIQWHLNNHPYRHYLYEHGYDSSVAQDFYPLFHVGEWEVFRDLVSLMPFPLFPEPRAGSDPIAHRMPGKRNIIRIENYDPGQAPDGTATTGGDYNLGAIAVQPLDIWIQALIYAEHNSWFVIPGVPFQATDAGDPEPAISPRYPRNGEPLDVQIHIWGAIAEGQAASLEDVTQWTARWRGANRTAYEAYGDPALTVDPTFTKRGGINYAFDPKLITDTRWVRFAQGEPMHQLPALPRLPVCPDLVYFGERPVQE
ncbi:MAG TPA: hypothetical protein PLU39_05025 [Armatimonadota bacterium]|nr:hypothetical protein [Armatimonadota bacterium]